MLLMHAYGILVKIMALLLRPFALSTRVVLLPRHSLSLLQLLGAFLFNPKLHRNLKQNDGYIHKTENTFRSTTLTPATTQHTECGQHAYMLLRARRLSDHCSDHLVRGCPRLLKPDGHQSRTRRAHLCRSIASSLRFQLPRVD